MVLGKEKSLTISFDCLNDSNVPVYSSGDTVSGRVNLEVTGEIRVKSLKIHARGHAKVRWTESRNAGSNTAYTQNYTEEVEYFNHKDVLIGHERGEPRGAVRSRGFRGCFSGCNRFCVTCGGSRGAARTESRLGGGSGERGAAQPGEERSPVSCQPGAAFRRTRPADRRQPYDR